MFALFGLAETLLLLLLYLTPFILFLRAHNHGALVFMFSALGFLVAFSVTCRVAVMKRIPNAQEVVDRTKTWYWMIGVFFATLAYHRAITFAFLAFLSFVTLREYFSLLPMIRPDTQGRTFLRRHDRSAIFLSYLTIPVMFTLAYYRWYGLYIVIVPVYQCLLIPLLLVMEDESRNFITSSGVLLWGNILFVFLLGHSAFVVNISPLLLVYAIFLTEMRDVIVYIFGKLTAPVIARHPASTFWRLYDRKIAPAISPRKNWGSALLTVLAIMGMSLAYRTLLPVFPRGVMSVQVALLLGLLIGVMGAVGDFVGSAFKRDLGVKDSGTALPGHGGVIDRLGSLCFTLPLVFHICYFLYSTPFRRGGL